MKKIALFSLFLTLLLLLASCTNDEKPTNEKQPTSGEKIDTTTFLRTHFINVGQADATLLQMKSADEVMNILIDTGDWNRKDVLAYLEKENIKDIDLIVITHPHADHIGQLDKIIEAVEVGEVWMNGDTSNAQVFSSALAAIEKHAVNYYEPTVGETFELGDMTIDILHPGDLSLGTNDNSIAMRIQYGAISFLYTGDGERSAEDKMVASGQNLQANILHLGHHGSNTSSTGNFLEAVNAEVAIYSAGIDNSYGHPDLEIIERVKARNMTVYGTAESGTLILETDGKSYNIMTEKNDTLPAPLRAKTCININTATHEELQKIKHIGDKLADLIIEARPFQSMDDLTTVKGIGDSRLQDIIEENLACTGG